MTFWYDEDQNVLIESGGTFFEVNNIGELVMDVDEMPQRKLSNMLKSIEDALDNNPDQRL